MTNIYTSKAYREARVVKGRYILDEHCTRCSASADSKQSLSAGRVRVHFTSPQSGLAKAVLSIQFIE